MLATGYYQVLFAQAPSIVGGVATQLPYLTGPLMPMAVTPTRGEDLNKLEEGYRSTDLRTVFLSGLRLDLGNQATGKDADRIIIAGKQFAVVHLEDWFEAGNYQKLIVEECDPRLDVVSRGYGNTALSGPSTSVGSGHSP